MIILIRHAQSEGNKNRQLHQIISDHRVKLTSEGWQQAEEAGRRLRSKLDANDTLQFFISPYRRTRETTEGILRTLTSDEPTTSPFPCHKIKVFEEPRLREQEFGNFQPCAVEVERIWQERADFGHFFYRIPNGESAADAYDRISGFNESMWRMFEEDDFPSVCVLVTHGMMARVFLMRWYHWSVEYFEDLRNVNHCEFITMTQNPEDKKYVLETEMRTWSDLKSRASLATNNSLASASAPSPDHHSSPQISWRRWGGCVNGCDHAKVDFPRRTRRQNTADFLTVSQGDTNTDNRIKDDIVSPECKSSTSVAVSTNPEGKSLSSRGDDARKMVDKPQLHNNASRNNSPTIPSDDSDYCRMGLHRESHPISHSSTSELSTTQEPIAWNRKLSMDEKAERTMEWMTNSGMGAGAPTYGVGDYNG